MHAKSFQGLKILQLEKQCSTFIPVGFRLQLSIAREHKLPAANQRVKGNEMNERTSIDHVTPTAAGAFLPQG